MFRDRTDATLFQPKCQLTHLNWVRPTFKYETRITRFPTQNLHAGNLALRPKSFRVVSYGHFDTKEDNLTPGNTGTSHGKDGLCLHNYMNQAYTAAL